MLERLPFQRLAFRCTITAMDRGARKLFFDWLALNSVDKEDGDDADNEEGEEEPLRRVKLI